MSKKGLNTIVGDVNLKLCLLGDGAVGKTSLRRTYLGQGFKTEYLETLGADFALKTLKYKDKDGKFDGTFKFQIWDLAGQPRFNQLRTTFYYGSQAALILYDITNPSSLDSVDRWLKELWTHNGKGSDIPVVIIGNKIDLREQIDQPLSPEDGKLLAEKLSEKSKFFIPFLETSAKTGENVEEAFQLITQTFIDIFFSRK
ncbi:MAG: GTP-binding protein [Candidatus Hodarchaeales archaeon]|jgi:small GTP-binding protein